MKVFSNIEGPGIFINMTRDLGDRLSWKETCDRFGFILEGLIAGPGRVFRRPTLGQMGQAARKG